MPPAYAVSPKVAGAGRPEARIMDTTSSSQLPLDENAVVMHCVAALRAAQWRVERSATTMERGIDIVAERNGARMYVEAKGVTSSKSGSNRYGMLQTSSQIFIQVSTALCTTAQLRSAEPHAEVMIAVPDHECMRRRLARIEPVLECARIGVLWVGSDGCVTPWNTSVLSA